VVSWIVFCEPTMKSIHEITRNPLKTSLSRIAALFHKWVDLRRRQAAGAPTYLFLAFLPAPIPTIVSNSSVVSGITDSCDWRINGRLPNLA